MQFFTATILNWKHLLKQDKYTELIEGSLQFLVEQGRMELYDITIMVNHIHLIRHLPPGHKRANVQRDFLKYTAQRIKAGLEGHHPEVLPHFVVNAKDRKQQIRERHPQSINLWSGGGVSTEAGLYASQPGAGRYLPVAGGIPVVIGTVLL